ncbi:MFS transporter [Pseudohalioglobus lutimaris]|uniref:MFS transporter n=2 Tax=Pseudohalioglobus lutimaris TaxID=1737061 RepID=A0A2N5WZA8_9GAMM|nr:MFS transporter [Pseudohalioglobus lutimaris]
MTPLERRTVSSLALLYSFRMLGLFMVLPLLALYAIDLPGADPLTIGLALGVYGLSQAVLQIPLGWLSDRVGRKPVIIGGLVVFALGSIVAAMADSIYGIVAGRALQGMGAIASTIMALVADLTREEQRTKAMAMVGMSIGMSFAVALVLGPIVAAAGGLAAVFWFTSLLAVAGMSIVAFVVPTPVKTAVHTDVGARQGLFIRSLRDAGLMRLNFAVFSLHFILMALFLLVPGLLLDVAGIDRDRHWVVYLPALVLSIAGMVPMMILAERKSRLREMFLLAIVLLMVAMGVMVAFDLAPAVYVGIWLFFVGFNYLEATLPSLVSKMVFSGGKGTALGIYATCQFLGAFAGGAVGGWLVKSVGPMAMVIFSIGLAAVWLLLFLPGNAVSTGAAATSE